MTSFARSARKDATTPRSKLGFEILVPYPDTLCRIHTGALRLVYGCCRIPIGCSMSQRLTAIFLMVGSAMQNSDCLAASIHLPSTDAWIPNFMFSSVDWW